MWKSKRCWLVLYLLLSGCAVWSVGEKKAIFRGTVQVVSPLLENNKVLWLRFEVSDRGNGKLLGLSDWSRINQLTIAIEGERIYLADGQGLIDRKLVEKFIHREGNYLRSIVNFWLLGKVAPNLVTEQHRKDETGRSLSFAQGGYRIEYLAYQGSRPKRVKIVHPEWQFTFILAN